MNHRHRKEAGFISVVFVELSALILGLCLLSLLIFGDWAVRIVVLTIVGILFAWMHFDLWRTRYRPGDHVKVTLGLHTGLSGTVREPLHGGSGARVALVVGDSIQIVDFHGGYELQKIPHRRTT
jgi:membrane protein implicated in regulation of membrane protease activity